ncbi:hypothetical protein C7271_24750, partial [filamentous cyanobacterium CCP5]
LETELSALEDNIIQPELESLTETAQETADELRSGIEDAVEKVVTAVQDTDSELAGTESNIASERDEFSTVVEQLQELLAPLREGVSSAQEMAEKLGIPWG